jgi:hypothetical protein
MIINIGGGGNVGYVLNVSTSAGATVTATKDGKSYTETSGNSGVATFTKLSKGTWTITATKGSSTKTTTVNMQGDCSITIVLNSVPEFTYTGNYKVYDANNADITSNPETQGDWKIKFLTSGTLTFEKLNGASNGIDIFCVGGGGNGSSSGAYPGGGGGGGRTVTALNKSVSTIDSYVVTIGGSGGASSFGNLATADGGSNATNECGGAGGSGGGATGYDGGSNGSKGTDWSTTYNYLGGAGLDESTGTKEFHESTGVLYAGGGGGAYHGGAVSPRQGMGGAGGGGNGAPPSGGSGYSGEANTGGGGGGGNPAGTGGSGVVIIRNKR